jgi:hypothetical protein
MAAWGKFIYQWDEYEMAMWKSVGICYDCNGIMPVEVLPKKSNNPYDIPKKTLNAFLRKRQSEPRCLECGGFNFEVIPNVTRNRERDKRGLPYRTGIQHRDCGGRIYADFTGPNFFMGDRNPTRYFSIEGIEIEAR